MNERALTKLRELQRAVARAIEISKQAALAERSQVRRRTVSATAKPKDVGADFTKSGANADAKWDDPIFKTADGKPMGAEAAGLCSLYKSGLRDFTAMPPDPPASTGCFSTALGPRALKGHELAALGAKLAAKGITIAEPMDFGGMNLESLNLAISEIEREIKVLNDAKLLGQRNWFYPFWEQSKLDALISRWERMLASKKDWERWQEASANRASVPDSPEKVQMRDQAEKMATEIRGLNEELLRGTISGPNQLRLGRLQHEFGLLDRKLQGR
jgi:hypothetical protein